MRQQQVVGPLLAAAALRGFHQLVDGALAAQDWRAANRLYDQVPSQLSGRPACSAGAITQAHVRLVCHPDVAATRARVFVICE